jgi:hypothetical protein
MEILERAPTFRDDTVKNAALLEGLTDYNGDAWVNQPVTWMQERILAPVYERLRRYTPSFAERVYR